MGNWIRAMLVLLLGVGAADVSAAAKPTTRMQAHQQGGAAVDAHGLAVEDLGGEGQAGGEQDRKAFARKSRSPWRRDGCSGCGCAGAMAGGCM